MCIQKARIRKIFFGRSMHWVAHKQVGRQSRRQAVCITESTTVLRMCLCDSSGCEFTTVPISAIIWCDIPLYSVSEVPRCRTFCNCSCFVTIAHKHLFPYNLLWHGEVLVLWFCRQRRPLNHWVAKRNECTKGSKNDLTIPFLLSITT